MGISIDIFRPTPGAILESNGRMVEVNDIGSKQTMRVTWQNPDTKNFDMTNDPWLFWSEVYKNIFPEDFTLPRVFTSMSDLANRDLSVNASKGNQSLDIFSSRILPLQILGKSSSPPVEVSYSAKIWTDQPHGTLPQFRLVKGVDVDLESLALASSNSASFRSTGKLTAGFTWDIEVGGVDGKNSMIIPVADLEVPNSDLKIVEAVGQKLAKNGFSGSLIRSGDFTHYFADFLLPKSLSAKVVGKLIDIFSPESDSFAHEMAFKLSRSKNVKDRRTVGEKLLDHYPTGGNSGSDLDLRWAGHIFTHNKGRAVIRHLDAKNYGFNPYEIAKIS